MANSRTSIVLYRSLLRAASRIQRTTKNGLLLTPEKGETTSLTTYALNKASANMWRSYGLTEIHFPPNDSTDCSDEKCDVYNLDNDSSPFLSGDAIKKLIEYNFKRSKVVQGNNEQDSGSDESINNSLDLGFRALSCLSLLSKQSLRSNTHVTMKGDKIKVRITTTSFYEAHLPGIEEHNYRYRVQVENIGQGSVQVCGRHWVFSNEQRREESVVAKYAQGVVGSTPIIHPGEGVQYTSQCFISTESGFMEGSFLFTDLDSEELFEGFIAQCRLFPQ